jgi:hypothetical protein
MKFWVSPESSKPHRTRRLFRIIRAVTVRQLPFVRAGAAHDLLHVQLEPHRADLLRLWADALDA